jgi:hypothetical protein
MMRGKDMEFESFEQALTVCMQAEDGSELQDAALLYCIDNAPPELKATLKERFLQFKASQCGCGHHDCDHHGHE